MGYSNIISEAQCSLSSYGVYSICTSVEREYIIVMLDINVLLDHDCMAKIGTIY